MDFVLGCFRHTQLGYQRCMFCERKFKLTEQWTNYNLICDVWLNKFAYPSLKFSLCNTTKDNFKLYCINHHTQWSSHQDGTYQKSIHQVLWIKVNKWIFNGSCELNIIKYRSCKRCWIEPNFVIYTPCSAMVLLGSMNTGFWFLSLVDFKLIKTLITETNTFECVPVRQSSAFLCLALEQTSLSCLHRLLVTEFHLPTALHTRCELPHQPVLPAAQRFHFVTAASLQYCSVCAIIWTR